MIKYKTQYTKSEKEVGAREKFINFSTFEQKFCDHRNEQRKTKLPILHIKLTIVIFSL